MFKSFLVLSFVNFIIPWTVLATEDTEILVSKQKEQAVIALQRHIRHYNFHQDKEGIFQKMYHQGCLYRDGKIEKYPKGSPATFSEAGINFLPLAFDGDVNAQLNLALIDYCRGDYDAASHWFARAVHQVSPYLSENQPKLLNNTYSLFMLSADIFLSITNDFDMNLLLLCRTLCKEAAQMVDKEFARRAIIKIPLACFESNTKKHPFPQTISFFIRRLLDDIPSLLNNPDREKKADKYLKCAEFSQEWGYKGENLFRYFGKVSKESSSSDFENTKQFFHQTYRQHEDARPDVDEMEIQLWYLSHFSRNELKDDSTQTKFTKIVDKMIGSQREKIACHYLNSAGNFLMENDLKESIFYYQLAAKLGDLYAQEACALHFFMEKNYEEAKKYYEILVKRKSIYGFSGMGKIMEYEGKIEEAKYYYQEAANQGSGSNQYAFGLFLQNLQDTKGAIKYFQKAVDQGYDDALIPLGFLFEKEGNLEKAKQIYHKILSNPELYHDLIFLRLGIIYEQQNQKDQAKIYFRMGAGRGDLQAQSKLNAILAEEERNTKEHNPNN